MVLACLAHWYISMLYVAPVVLVALWCRRSTKRTPKKPDSSGGAKAASGPGVSPTV